jgi:hypothetical protein
MSDEREQGGGAASARRQAPASLTDGAAQWLGQLPQRVRPALTIERFPHIANALAGLWATPRHCRVYFDELLLDLRGDRQGFPKAVASELAALKDYYDSVVHPTQQTVWDEIISQPRG